MKALTVAGLRALLDQHPPDRLVAFQMRERTDTTLDAVVGARLAPINEVSTPWEQRDAKTSDDGLVLVLVADLYDA